MTTALEGGERSAARPGRTLPPGKTRYSFYRRLGGLQGRSGRAENLVPTGIRSRTVQPVAQSLYRLSYRATSSPDNIYPWTFPQIGFVLKTPACYKYPCTNVPFERTEYPQVYLHEIISFQFPAMNTPRYCRHSKYTPTWDVTNWSQQHIDWLLGAQTFFRS